MLEIHCIKNARNEKSTFDLRWGHSAIWVSHFYISNQWLKSMFSLFKRLRFGRYTYHPFRNKRFTLDHKLRNLPYFTGTQNSKVVYSF